METLQKVNYTCEALDFLGQLPTDEYLEGYKADLIDMDEIRKLLILCNQFFYITDLNQFSNAYVSSNVGKILGFDPIELADLNVVYSLIHPEDREFVWEFSLKTLEFSRKYCDILRANPYSAVFSIDFRMRCNKGTYIRVNRQTSCYKTDNEGNMIYALSLFTDIDHIKRSNLITYAWKADFELNFSIDDLVERFQQKIITNREIEVIRLLSLGLSGVQISQKLFISPNTVIRHRKNILHKTGAKNTAELMRYAIENSWI